MPQTVVFTSQARRLRADVLLGKLRQPGECIGGRERVGGRASGGGRGGEVEHAARIQRLRNTIQTDSMHERGRTNLMPGTWH